MNTIIKWVLFAILIIAISWIIPGISISGFWSALITVIIMGLINIFIRPIIELISLPINYITLGLFSLVINALLFLLVSKISPGFEIDGFWNAFMGALILSFISPFIDKIGIKTA